ncbi:zinc finger protein 600 isoform X3 [Dermacentor silvarum]|uniref:zinc finger protein 600 isoform X3 n=1 Tax=Dermacentor silvarum TaxID=543639 RepID=UPI0021015D4B|nr:zinc finger protein 600 isoform X3 [Dermacentor silvarum]
MPKTTEEEAARRERRRELAREGARRRRANPEVRAREAEYRRLRREANPEAYARQLAARRQRMQADPELRARKSLAVRQRLQAYPELRARKAEVQRQRRVANPEVRARDAERQRRRRNQVPGLRESEAAQRRHRRQVSTGGADRWLKTKFLDRDVGHSCDRLWFDSSPTQLKCARNEEQRLRDDVITNQVTRQNLADCCRHKSVAAVSSTTVVQEAAATQRDRREDVADKSTCCEEGTSKSTQAELFTLKVSRWAQSDDIEERYGASPQPELPQPNKAMPLVLSNSRRSDSGVQEEANVDDATEGYGRPSADTDAACSDERGSSLTVNAGSAAVPYSCRLCSLKFIELDALASHVLTCPWPEPFQCSLCSEMCMDWRATRRHLASHINKDAQKCPFCEQTLDRKSWTFMRHMQRQHVHVKAFMCNFCWATFVMKQDILTHSRRCRAKVDKYMRLTEKRNSPAHAHPYTYQCSICLDTFVNISVAACHMQVHMNEMQQDHMQVQMNEMQQDHMQVHMNEMQQDHMQVHMNEMQHNQAEEVIKKHPSDCREQRSVATESTRVLQGDASTQCDFRARIAIKSMLSAKGFSKATEAELYIPKVSVWTQSEDLEDCSNASSLLELPLLNEAMPQVPGNSSRTSSEMQEDAELGCVAGSDSVFKVTTDAPCSEGTEGSATVDAGPVVIAYACGLCPRKFQDLDSLASHVLTCPWPEPFQCSLCSESCANWIVTWNHLLASHISKAAEKCPFCEETLNGRNTSTANHMLRLHVGVKLFRCNLCRDTFYCKPYLLHHVRRCHEGGVPHECDWCASSFSDKRDLQAHVRRHLSAWPYKCHVCSATFVKRSDIASHLRGHKIEGQWFALQFLS